MKSVRDLVLGLCAVIAAGCFHGPSSTSSTPETVVSAAPGAPATEITPILAIPPQVLDPDLKDQIDVGDNSGPIPPESQPLFRDDFSDLANSRGQRSSIAWPDSS